MSDVYHDTVGSSEVDPDDIIGYWTGIARAYYDDPDMKVDEAGFAYKEDERGRITVHGRYNEKFVNDSDNPPSHEQLAKDLRGTKAAKAVLERFTDQ